jgi:hypothetical protein
MSGKPKQAQPELFILCPAALHGICSIQDSVGAVAVHLQRPIVAAALGKPVIFATAVQNGNWWNGVFIHRHKLPTGCGDVLLLELPTQRVRPSSRQFNIQRLEGDPCSHPSAFDFCGTTASSEMSVRLQEPSEMQWLSVSMAQFLQSAQRQAAQVS